MTPNWLDYPRGYIAKSDHKLIGQAGTNQWEVSVPKQ